MTNKIGQVFCIGKLTKNCPIIINNHLDATLMTSIPFDNILNLVFCGKILVQELKISKINLKLRDLVMKLILTRD